MPHDIHDNELRVGDCVMVPCKIKAIHLTEEFCNLDLETSLGMWPSDAPLSLTLNSRQTVKVEQGKTREWYEQNDPQALVDSINAANAGNPAAREGAEEGK